MNGQALVIASIAGKNYLPRIRVLAASLREHHPDLQLMVLLSDQLAGDVDHADEPFQFVQLNQLQGLNAQQFCFRYDLRQRSSALKPYFLEYLLDQQHAAVLFLDPDMLVTAPLNTLLDSVRNNPILLTPHLLQPPADARCISRELEILQAGIFNAGVIGVSGCEQARHFLHWWKQRLEYHAKDSVAEGMYYDQRWLDLAPGLFPALHILRDPGCNVAHWNLNERRMSIHGQAVRVDGKTCSLVHFSGYDPQQPERLSQHAEWLNPAADAPVRALMAAYRQRLSEAEKSLADSWQPSWEQLANNLPLAPVLRTLYASLDPARWHADPFNCSEQSFFHWLMQPIDDRQPVVLQLWQQLHHLLPALHLRWPDALGSERQAYADWIKAEGWQFYGLSAWQQHLATKLLLTPRLAAWRSRTRPADFP
jgi:hypothetical protein